MARGKGWKVDKGAEAIEVIETVAASGEGNDVSAGAPFVSMSPSDADIS